MQNSGLFLQDELENWLPVQDLSRSFLIGTSFCSSRVARSRHPPYMCFGGENAGQSDQPQALNYLRESDPKINIQSGGNALLKRSLAADSAGPGRGPGRNSIRLAMVV